MTFNLDIGSQAMWDHENQSRLSGGYSHYGKANQLDAQDDLVSRMLSIHQQSLNKPEQFFFKTARKLGVLERCFPQQMEHFQAQATLHLDAESFDEAFTEGAFQLDEGLQQKLNDLSARVVPETRGFLAAKTTLAEFKAKLYRDYMTQVGR